MRPQLATALITAWNNEAISRSEAVEEPEAPLGERPKPPAFLKFNYHHTTQNIRWPRPQIKCLLKGDLQLAVT